MSAPSFDFSNVFTEKKKKKKATKPKKGHGNFFTHLLGDVRDLFLGLPHLKDFVVHPIRTFKAVGKSYAELYGPLFHGHFGEFAHNVEEHPLGPILDVTAAAAIPFTAGGSAIARGGLKGFEFGAKALQAERLASAASRAAEATRASRGLHTYELKPLEAEHEAIKIPLSRNAYTRTWQRALRGALDTLPETTPILGRGARYAWSARRYELDPLYEKLMHEPLKLLAMSRRLKPHEAAAVFLRAETGTNEALARAYPKYLRESGEAIDPDFIRLLEHPETMKAYLNPKPGLARVMDQAEHVSQLDSLAKKARGEITDAQFMARPYTTARIIGGAKYINKAARKARIDSIDRFLKRAGQEYAQAERRLKGLQGKYGVRRQPELRAAETARVEAELIGSRPTSGYRAAMREAKAADKAADASFSRRVLLRPYAEMLDETEARLASLTDEVKQLMEGQVDYPTAFQRWGVRVTPRTDLAKARLQVLGRAYDELVATIALRDKAAAAMFGLNDELERAVQIVERQRKAGAGLRTELVSQEAKRLAARRRAEVANQALVEALQAQKRVLEKYQEGIESLQDLRRQMEENYPGWEGGKSLEEIISEFEEGGFKKPFYFPHASELPKIILRSHGLSPGTARKLKVNEGVLAGMGRLAVNPAVLGAAFIDTMRIQFKSQTYHWLTQASKKVDPGYALKKGEVFIGKKPGHLDRTLPMLEEEVDDAIRAMREAPDLEPGDWVVSDASLAATEDGKLLVIRRSDAKSIVGEWKASSRFSRYLYEKPTNIWRAIVLGLRPGFLTNNLFGNLFLYAIAWGGPDGLRGLWEWGKSAKVQRAARRAGKAGPESELEKLMSRFFAQELRGTFGLQQTEGLRHLHPDVVARDWHSIGFLPLTQHVAERGMREAGVAAEIFGSPEIQARLRAMPKESRSIWAAAGKEFEKNPELVRHIASQVENALGNYVSMGLLERGILRQVWPFYAWYRAISMIAIRLPFHAPHKLKIMQMLTQMWYEKKQDEFGEFPSFLAGAIPMGDSYQWIPGFSELVDKEGRVPVFLTQGLNPFQSAVDVGDAFRALVKGGTEGRSAELLSGINPILQSVIETATGRSLLTGAPLKRKGGITGIAEGVITGLPPVRLVSQIHRQGDEKSMYLKNFAESLSSYLGTPIRGLNLDTAEFIRKLETGELVEDVSFVNPVTGLPPARKKTKSKDFQFGSPSSGFKF